MDKRTQRIIIVGAGLAGLSLATSLADEGFEVIVLEKNRYLGGRASNSIDKKMHDPVPIGPHIYVALYNNFRHFLEKIGAGDVITWKTKILFELIWKKQHYQMRPAILPPPFYLFPMMANYPFMSVADKLSNVNVTMYILFTSFTNLEKFDEINAYDFLLQHGVTKNAIDKFWRFFVLAMLNVPLELCSATEFCFLTKNWMRAKHYRVGLSTVGLGDVYVEKAKEYITKKGGKVYTNAKVKEIVFEGNKVKHMRVVKNGIPIDIKGDVFCSTLTPVDLRTMLPNEILFTEFFRGLDAFEGVPYISVNLWFDRKISDKQFWALLNDEDTPMYINTDFYDQSNIYKTRKHHSFITSNIIYSKAYNSMSDKQIVAKTVEEIKEVFPNFNAKLTHYHIHRIPYVIYAPYPGMRKHKLAHQTPFKNFYVAGDWTVGETAQCMESAVRSGYQCAEEILKNFGIVKKVYEPTVS